MSHVTRCSGLKPILTIAAGLTIALLAGCSSSHPHTAQVSGVVTLNNQPVADAAVMFFPNDQGRPAEGVTDAQGHFVLRTFADDDGALLGVHSVSVTKMEMHGVTPTSDGLSGAVERGGVREQWIVPQKYADPKTSGLEFRVEDGMAPIRLELKSK